MNWKLSKKLLEWLSEGNDVDFSIETHSFLHHLTKEGSKTEIRNRVFPWHPAFVLTLILCEIILGITLILTGTAQLVRDDILYTNKQTVNSQGCLSVKQGLSREYALYLFNTSELWSDTGIELSTGDKYRMSFSGAFHSSIGHLVAESENNNSSPAVIWTSCDPIEYQEHNKEFCLDSSSDLGTILYCIGPFHSPKDASIKPKAWHRSSFTITKDNLSAYEKSKYKSKNYKYSKIKKHQRPNIGTLQLAVNDIFFKDSARLSDYSNSLTIPQGSDQYSGKHLRFKEAASAISFFPSYYSLKETSLEFVDTLILAKDSSLFQNNYSRMLYDDNLGQILVCLEIEHPIKNWLINPKAPFRRLERQIRTYRYYSKPFWAFVRSSIWFAFVFLPCIILIFLFWFIVLFLVLYSLYCFGWWISRPFLSYHKLQ